MIEVGGTHRVDVAPAVLWAELSDPGRLADSLPQVGDVAVASADDVSATVRPATGLGVTPLALDLRIVERDEPRRVRMVGEGTGGEYAVTFDVALELADDAGGCRVAWSGNVRALGVLGSLTQRVLPMVLGDQIVDVLEAAAGASRSAA